MRMIRACAVMVCVASALLAGAAQPPQTPTAVQPPPGYPAPGATAIVNVLNLKSEQTAPPQAMVNPNLPPGTEVTLQNLTGTVTGTSRLNLTELIPTTDLNGRTSSTMEMRIGGNAQPLTTNVEVKVTIAPAK